MLGRIRSFAIVNNRRVSQSKYIFLTAMLICVGVAAYPVGWYTQEIRDACGDEADIFNLGNKLSSARNSTLPLDIHRQWIEIILPAGDCQLSWSCYLMSASVGVLLLCVGLSVKASKVKPGSIRLWCRQSNATKYSANTKIGNPTWSHEETWSF